MQPRGKHRLIVLLAVVAMVATACGARLTNEQRLAGIGAGRGGVAAAGDKQGTDVGVDTGANPGTGATTGTGSNGGISGGGPAPTLPPEGNGGKTDIGVLGNQITIATVSDVGGIQPGLFKATHQAISALAAYVNSQGGIYGRALKTLLLDSRADAQFNASGVTEACDKAFAMVGSMSAFDDGGVKAGESCNIPDISAITVNGSRTLAKNVYPAYPVRPDWFMIGTGNYIKEQYPEAIKKAGFVWLNAAVARQTHIQRRNALAKIGFNWVYEKELQLVEGNYNPFVQDMKKAGVKYLTYIGDYQSIVRILQEAQDEQYHFDVVDLDSVAYSPKFLTDGGSAVNGVKVFINTAMLEEVGSNPEMQLYKTWLGHVAPGAKPDYFGLYAWSAGRLFVKAATDAGPKLTRAGLFTAIRAIHSWTGYGIQAALDAGNKMPTHCFIYVEVKSGKFVRKHPASAWECNKGPLVKT